jgi:hypothetical protein
MTGPNTPTDNAIFQGPRGNWYTNQENVPTEQELLFRRLTATNNLLIAAGVVLALVVIR